MNSKKSKEFVGWGSQPYDQWAERYASGKFVDLDGRQTHYIEKGEGDPVILLHGFFYDSFLWQANLDALSRHFKVYALDLWGFGYSTRELQDFGYALYVDQVRLFMDAIEIQSASLVGQSMGGGIAMSFSVLNRERVKSLILVAAAGLPNRSPLMVKFFNLPTVGELLLKLKGNGIRESGLKDFFIYDKSLLTKEYVESVTWSHKIKGSIEVSLYIQRKQFFDKLEDEIWELSSLSVPTLIVWGKHDKAIPLERGVALHKILAGSEFHCIEQAGHVPNFERAEKFNERAIDFLLHSCSLAC